MLQEQLDQLPKMRPALKSFVQKSITAQGGGAKVRSTSGHSEPISVHVIYLIDAVDALLAAVEHLGVYDILSRDDLGLDCAFAIGKLWRQVNDAIGLAPPAWSRRFARCPNCSLQALGTLEGSDTVQCSNCGASMSRDEYDGMCLVASRVRIAIDRSNN